MSRPGRRLVVVRHGRTAWNAEGRYQGQADPPLDEVGEAQARAVPEALAAFDPVLLVASDLRRAVATAAPIATATGLPVVTDVRLREVDLGGWEGLTPTEAAARFPDEAARWEAGEDVARGGGETRAAAGGRAADAVLEHLDGVPPGSVVVVVAHGLVLRSALRVLRDRGLADLDADPPHLDNGRWMAVDVVTGRS